jgi:hypothetical protein
MSLLESSFSGPTSPPAVALAVVAGFVSSFDGPRPHDHTSADDNAIHTNDPALFVVISHHLDSAG